MSSGLVVSASGKPCAFMGREEVCLVLPRTELDGAGLLARRLAVVIRAQEESFTGGPLYVNDSIGVAQAGA